MTFPIDRGSNLRMMTYPGLFLIISKPGPKKVEEISEGGVPNSVVMTYPGLFLRISKPGPNVTVPSDRGSIFQM